MLQLNTYYKLYESQIPKWYNTNIVYLKDKENDIPCFEHGFVHVWDAYTNKYLGLMGQTTFYNMIETILGDINGSNL